MRNILILFLIVIIAFSFGSCTPVNTEVPVTSKVQEEEKSSIPSYKKAVEDSIAEHYSEKKLDFDAWTNYRQWELGGLIYVENQFKMDGKNHTYLARCGGDELFYLKVDGKVIYKDIDAEDKFLGW